MSNTQAQSAQSNQQAGDSSNQPSFSIQRVYGKNHSFKLGDYKSDKQQSWNPVTQVAVNSTNKKLGQDHYEVVLTLKTSSKIDEQTLFEIEFEQAGIFLIKNFEEAQVEQMLGAFCLGMLYPYASEAISTMVNRAGYPPIYLPVVNFEAAYQQRKQQEAKKRQESEAVGSS